MANLRLCQWQKNICHSSWDESTYFEKRATRMNVTMLNKKNRHLHLKKLLSHHRLVYATMSGTGKMSFHLQTPDFDPQPNFWLHSLYGLEDIAIRAYGEHFTGDERYGKDHVQVAGSMEHRRGRSRPWSLKARGEKTLNTLWKISTAAFSSRNITNQPDRENPMLMPLFPLTDPKR